MTRSLHDQSIGIAYIYCEWPRQKEQQLEDRVAILERWRSLQQASEKKDKTNFGRDLKDPSGCCGYVFESLHCALDECQASNGCRSIFLSEIFNLQKETTTNIFATSRPVPEIEKAFSGCISEPISASEGNIRIYLDSHMNRLPGFVLESTILQENIKAEIIRAVDGMYEALSFSSILR
ncbi:uncharacterized protein N7484_009240 [Penicillium longicatenatum]|uniref:uncharacterized protein n=1 Tax=Penicillium longicatenatum TaxID=1561947 RepID=UPI00254906AD|nr:uncharacterized protein N7484_009240 [Penicillium longicatenatum]KAJ5635927.1 hypothetical protein N7484_009240 [Penicillium longicatenatum]